eukprot:scaffold5024_cov136-Cylindrotheca_fusiformis.AAC.32
MDSSNEAFQAFMLGNKSPSVKTPSSAVLRPSGRNPGSSSKKSAKRHGPILKAFQGRVQEWKECDDQLYQVLNSIVNLRNRIWWEKKHLNETQRESKAWSGCGYRTHNRSLLLPDDSEMALSNDLLNHERMLSAARTLISSMALAQEAMGRRLDELYQLGGEDGSDRGNIILNQTLCVFHVLGGELYRKQLSISEIIDSCHNGLIDEASTDNLRQPSNPRAVAQKCYAKWSSHVESKEEWSLVEDFLNGGT